MKRSLTVLLLLVSFVTLAIAHGNEQHVMGTVTKISGSQVTIETVNHQQVTVTVTDKTEFSNGAAKATLSDLKAGDRVVIHATKEGTTLAAHVVKFAPAPNGGTKPSGKRDQHSETR